MAAGPILAGGPTVPLPPAGGPTRPSLAVAALALLPAVAAIAVGARVDLPVPGSPVPQSLQTLAVVLAGALLGPRRGMVAVLVYLAAGATGLPVFAGGASGIHQLIGPTGGYLLGFVLGAGIAGALADPLHRALLGMLLAHLVILGLGWGRLALLLGPEAAWVHGVAPFLWGGAVKSAVALCMLALVRGRPGALTARAASG